MLAFDIAPTIAATAALVTGALAAWTAASARRTKRRGEDVDAIRVTQEALAGTVQLQHEDNERLRARLRAIEADFSVCMRRFDLLRRRCEEAGIVVDDE